MSITFYYSPMSTAVITALVLEELGIPHERITLNIQQGDTKKPEFLKINPNGVVPTIVHEGTAIGESTAITMYLGETFGVEKKLYPTAGVQRAQAMMWIAWANVTLGEAVGRLMRNASEWFPKDQQNEKAAEAARSDLQKRLKVLDDAVANKPFLLGEYTLADTHTNSIVDWLRMSKIDMSAYPNVNAWSQRCAARPAYAKVMSTH
jgi:glutathione S-transferase